MVEHDTHIATADGVMNTFVVHPDAGSAGSRFPVVLFLMDAPGKREELHQMAARSSAPHPVEGDAGVEHGCVFAQRAGYDLPAAERHWEHLFNLFRRTLQSP